MIIFFEKILVNLASDQKTKELAKLSKELKSFSFIHMTAYTEETFGFRDKIVLIRPSMEGHEDYITVYQGELIDC